jgi:hypothetical protein
VQPAELPLDEMNPKELLLASMGKCAAMTAVALFTKMRLNVSELRVDTSGVIVGDPARGPRAGGARAGTYLREILRRGHDARPRGASNV